MNSIWIPKEFFMIEPNNIYSQWKRVWMCSKCQTKTFDKTYSGMCVPDHYVAHPFEDPPAKPCKKCSPS